MGEMNNLAIDEMNARQKGIYGTGKSVFFSRITADHWQAKNRLEEAAKLLAREKDRILVPENKVQDFLNEFEQKIKELDILHKRCKPLSFSWHRGYTKGWTEWWIYCDGVFQMSLIEAKAYE
jgi:hypothetical protein